MLEKYPQANVRVHAVWFNMLASDRRSRYTEILTDSRVTNYWDETKSVGRWFGLQREYGDPARAPVVWDAYMFYGPRSTWGDGISDLVIWSERRPIVRARDSLEEAFQREFGR